MAATADAVSGGRLILGLGAGWHDPEYEAFGFPKDHRVDRFEESLQIIGPLLRGETLTFSGNHYAVDGAFLAPAPERRIPLLVAATGPRMLGLTARYAGAWNTAWYGAPEGGLRDQLEAFGDSMAKEGRDPATMTRTVGMIVNDPGADVPEDDEDSFSGPVDELAKAIDGYAALGIDHLIVFLQPISEASLDHLSAAVRLSSLTR
jgi:alkanesulfonate monooxygenase SsuD/methylene tetrahydromethanopterin reductase-like flavin-dependent oxidoreductase (luciferase family)